MKIKLCGLGNERNFSYYIFEKKQKVVEVLADIFGKVFDLELMLYEEYQDKKEKWINKKRDIKNFKDFHESIGSINGKSRIDFFYGDKKLFVSIHCSEKLRLKFNRELAKISFIPKSKKLK